MAMRDLRVAMLVCTFVPSAMFAQLPGSTGDCPEGTMLAPAPPMNPMGSAAMNPTGAIASAAKKKLLGSKESKPDSVVPAKPKCLTPEQYTAEMKAQQSAAMKGAVTGALSATPYGMAIVGAKAAAPLAGKAAGALSNRFRRGPSKESMSKALVAGRLEVENVTFDTGSDSPKASSNKSLATLVDALKETQGQFIIKVTSESNGTASADPKLAQRRAALITATLIQAGVPADRVTAQPLTITTSWDSGAPKKSDARLEVVSVAPPQAATKQ